MPVGDQLRIHIVNDEAENGDGDGNENESRNRQKEKLVVGQGEGGDNKHRCKKDIQEGSDDRRNGPCEITILLEREKSGGRDLFPALGDEQQGTARKSRLQPIGCAGTVEKLPRGALKLYNSWQMSLIAKTHRQDCTTQ